MGKKRRQMFRSKYAGHPRSRLNKGVEEIVVTPPNPEEKPAEVKKPAPKPVAKPVVAPVEAKNPVGDPKKVAPITTPKTQSVKKATTRYISKKSKK